MESWGIYNYLNRCHAKFEGFQQRKLLIFFSLQLVDVFKLDHTKLYAFYEPKLRN